MINISKIDVSKMAKETGILEYVIKQALEAPKPEIDNITTIEEATKIYYDSSENSAKQKAALLKWREFSAEEIEIASTIKELKKVYYRAFRGSEEATEAIRKIAKFFLKS